jgi:hypothetical protein
MNHRQAMQSVELEHDDDATSCRRTAVEGRGVQNVLSVHEVKLFLCLIKQQTTNTFRGAEILLHNSSLRHWTEVNGQLHAQAALPPVSRVL